MSMRIGIDLGGTKIAAAVLNREGIVLGEGMMPTPRDYDALVANCRTLVQQLEAKVKQTCTVGVGLPGYTVKATGRCFTPNIPCAMDKPFAADFGRALGGRTIRTANDADCMTLSEAVDGAARGHRVAYGVIMGTGVGGGLVINRQIVPGANGFTEWGHLPFPWREGEDGLPVKCNCGRMGCIDTVISGRGLARLHQIKTGKEIKGEEITALAHQGDKTALATLEHFYRLIAKAMLIIVSVVDPDVIVIGGGLSGLPDLPVRLQKHCQDMALSHIAETPFVIARHGPASGMRGAAWLWHE